MFCGKCGKEMDSSAKFCPYCGAENQNRTPVPPTAKPTVPVKLSGGTVDMAKIALMVLGALHTLLFFTMSYGQIHLMSALNAIVGSNFSNRLTALNAISLMKGCADLGIDGAGVALDDAVAQLSELGFKHLVYTDIARDGMQTGIDVAAYRHVAEVAGFPVVASGGISTLDDIRALAAVGGDAIEGAITGRALYEGNFTLAQALAAARGEE